MTRAGFVAVIGAPNAGKSTLVNRLVGTKVSIVTQKVQTTRFPVRGVAIEGDAQMVLVDTPGIFQPRRRFDRAMIRAAWTRAEEAEAIVHLVDANAQIAIADGRGKSADRRAGQDVQAIIAGLKTGGRPALLALNKIDLVRPEQLLGLTKSLFETEAYGEVFMVSAASGAGVDDLKARLGALMPDGPWFYPEDQSADLPVRLLAAEITREKVYLRVHEELPYAANIETTAFEERQDGSVRIEQTIYVERDGQRGILLGKSGETLKWVGSESRRELTSLLDRQVHLFLHVKVMANWSEDPRFFSSVGLDFDV
jgi:GTP-binding protein Era